MKIFTSPTSLSIHSTTVRPHPIKRAKTLFMVSVTAAMSAALASCASTSIANRTPIDIASNSVRHTDTLSGVSEVLAPRIKAFNGRRSAVRGTAQLRTAGAFSDEAGNVLRGGAYIDVQIKYQSATPHPGETRRYDIAMWPGGQTALVADWGGGVTDCREDVRSVPQYTPIYGAFGYGHVHDDICGHRGRGHSGWGRGYGHYGHGHVHDDTCGHGVDDGDDTVIVAPTTNPRPVSRPDRPRRPGVTPPHPDGHGTDPDGPGGSNGSIYRPRPRPGQPHPLALPHTGKKVISRPRFDVSPAPQTAPHRAHKPAPKVVSRPRPQPVSKPAPTSSPVSKPSVSRQNPSRRTRTVTPQTRTHTVTRKMRYYPRERYYDDRPRDYVVRRSCDRQEDVRIFVPRQRLDAARENGLIVYLRPRGGQEEVLSLPPNYINGFALAAWSPQGEQLTIPGGPRNLSASPTVPTVPSSTPNTLPQHPANTPIIYGEP